jgi:hypothetical protein
MYKLRVRVVEFQFEGMDGCIGIARFVLSTDSVFVGLKRRVHCIGRRGVDH